ncbi:hypothetical protein PENTCL1PPCAC_21722 [Pristionchus entomophagus]|uniref:Uncharacterized protein n=1 Tax=Pristionchus entomophagus TaxID=358040 RepID=A0AAV5TZD4_9BILA|nr:hypothetical protein PENTCL1PPCAC_21722 [Pristionchus entomophagus]
MYSRKGNHKRSGKNTTNFFTQIRPKLPNRNIVPLTVQQFYTMPHFPRKADIKLVTIPCFPVSSHLEITTMLHAAYFDKWKLPHLDFTPAGGNSSFFMRIKQKFWGSPYSHWLYLWNAGSQALCVS